MPKTTRHPTRYGTGSEQRVRTRQITYRLTPEEYATIERAGEERGWSSSQYARAVDLADSGHTIPAVPRRRVTAPPELRAALPALSTLLGDVRHIRALLNQLAARANSGAVGPAMTAYTKAETVVRNIANQIVAAALGDRSAP